MFCKLWGCFVPMVTEMWAHCCTSVCRLLFQQHFLHLDHKAERFGEKLIWLLKQKLQRFWKDHMTCDLLCNPQFNDLKWIVSLRSSRWCRAETDAEGFWQNEKIEVQPFCFIATHILDHGKAPTMSRVRPADSAAAAPSLLTGSDPSPNWAQTRRQRFTELVSQRRSQTLNFKVVLTQNRTCSVEPGFFWWTRVPLMWPWAVMSFLEASELPVDPVTNRVIELKAGGRSSGESFCPPCLQSLDLLCEPAGLWRWSSGPG